MSDQLMDTEPGGESTQYESIKTVTEPSSKSGGTMGKPETETATSGQTSEEAADRGERTADNIRYGQNISESGMGGMTTTSEGQANSDVGFGGTEDEGQSGGEEKAVEGREASGYGGKEDMDNEIGG